MGLRITYPQKSGPCSFRQKKEEARTRTITIDKEVENIFWLYDQQIPIKQAWPDYHKEEKECGVQPMQTQEKTHADTEDEARIKELSIAIRDHEEKEKEVRDRQRKHKI